MIHPINNSLFFIYYHHNLWFIMIGTNTPSMGRFVCMVEPLPMPKKYTLKPTEVIVLLHVAMLKGASREHHAVELFG
jgi:hypothetical protein